MSPLELVNNLESYFRHQLPTEQSEMLVKKLARFTPTQLDVLYEKTIEECKYLFARGANPVAQLFDVARDLGYLASPVRKFTPHTWRQSDCKRCNGSGMVAVFLDPYMTPEGVIEKRIMAIMPYADGPDYQHRHPKEYSSFSRCSCPAGEAKTLGQDWPRLNQSQKYPAWEPITKPRQQGFERARIKQFVQDAQREPESVLEFEPEPLKAVPAPEDDECPF